MIIFIGIVFLAIGILRYTYPSIGWRPKERWMMNSIARYIGFIMILAGSIFILIGILTIG